MLIFLVPKGSVLTVGIPRLEPILEPMPVPKGPESKVGTLSGSQTAAIWSPASSSSRGALCKNGKIKNSIVPESIPGSCDDRLPIPPNGVLGLGLVRGGKAFAGDCGLLKAELREVGKPCML